MFPLDIALSPTERYGPVVAIIALSALAAFVALIVLRSLRRR